MLSGTAPTSESWIPKRCTKSNWPRIWQAFVALLPVKTVGVMGDGRTYDYALALRAVFVTNNTQEFSRVPGLQVENWQSVT